MQRFARIATIFLLTLTTVVIVQAGDNPPPVQAHFVGDTTCLECHAEYALPTSQIHSRIETFEVRGHPVGCEGCHGPGSAHSEELDPALIGGFGSTGLGNDACLSCHRGKGIGQWHASTHAIEGVGCTDCHTIHSLQAAEAPSAKPRFARAQAAEAACTTCHGDVVAQFRLPSHHPLPEGKMACADCHDVHSSREGMLRTQLRPNDLCFNCHQNIEGPYIFEHEPVLEGCDNCHTPHGAVADSLLVANEPTLCLQCHEPHFHSAYRGSDDDEVEIGGMERGNPFGARGMNIAFTTSCTQCHSQVHGSDLPSQTVPSRGRGLTQ